MSRKALGKGLSILYGETEQDESDVSQSAIPLSQIEPNPFQPRIDFNGEQIEELAKSIKEQGLLQPIVVRKISDQKYQIVSGERRFRALKLLNEKDVSAIVRDDIDDKQMLELALVENIQRENLNEIETALSYKKLIEFCDYSHQELSDRLGKSRALITNTLRLLKLPQDVQAMLRDKQISAGHAKVLLAVENPTLQIQLAREVVKETLSVRETEKKLSSVLNGGGKKDSEISVKKEKILANKYSAVLSNIKNLLGFELRIIEDGNGKTGKVEIKFANTDEFEKIINVLNKDDMV